MFNVCRLGSLAPLGEAIGALTGGWYRFFHPLPIEVSRASRKVVGSWLAHSISMASISNCALVQPLDAWYESQRSNVALISGVSNFEGYACL